MHIYPRSSKKYCPILPPFQLDDSKVLVYKMAFMIDEARNFMIKFIMNSYLKLILNDSYSRRLCHNHFVLITFNALSQQSNHIQMLMQRHTHISRNQISLLKMISKFPKINIFMALGNRFFLSVPNNIDIQDIL